MFPVSHEIYQISSWIGHGWSPTPTTTFIKGAFEFLKFPQKGGLRVFPKRLGVHKIGGCSKKGDIYNTN